VEPLFNTNLVAGVIYWGTLAGWYFVEARQAGRSREDAKAGDAGSQRVIRYTLRGGILAAIFFSWRVPAARIHASPLTIFLIAMPIIWAGMGLRYWAFVTLGAYFTFTVMTSDDQAVVTNGPYRFLRHPSYAGGLLILAGIGLALGNWLSLAANIVLPLIGLLNRVRVEEDALRTSLGERYAAFAAGRKRLIPFVW
jgi:protein-S-isoprenylcysteine O-methyltransferase Ste14